jgi:ligand-binding sensor domain-containing protein
VSSILQDRSGAMWFGSYTGVTRYDGVSWRTYTSADGLAGPAVNAMLEDRSGALWFGTYYGSVTRYDGVSWRTFTTTDGLADTHLHAILEDRSGALWFGTNFGGASRYDGTSWRTFTTADGLANNRVEAMIEDRNGVLWFGTAAGVSRYDGVSWRTFTTADGLADNYVVSILEDRSGALWFGTFYAGVSRYDGVSWRTFTTADGMAGISVACMLEARDGALWFGTSPFSYTGGGVSRYDGVSWRTFTTADGLAYDGVSAMLEDSSGALWFGTGDGVSRYDGASWRTFTTADGLADNFVYSMLQDRTGTLWIGTGVGVSRYDGVSWRTFTSVDGLGDNYVPSMLEGGDGTLWFANQGVTAHTPDRVPPRTAFPTRPRAASANSVPSISYVPAFDDQDIQFQYSLNNEPWSAWSPGVAWPSRFLPDGRYEFRVRARDDYDNVESPPESLRFEIDATPPSPSILVPGANAAVRESVAIRGTAADARFAYYRLECRARGAAAWITLVDRARAAVADGLLGGWNTRGLTDGRYELRLSVADTLGLTGTLVVPVSVDNEFPFAAQTSPALVTAAMGGDVYTDDAAAHLYIPPHGLARDTIVTVWALAAAAVPATLPDGATRLSPGVELSWGTVALTRAATLDLAIPAGAGGAAVVYAEGADLVWRRLGGTVDGTSGRVTVSVTAAGRYALFTDTGAPATTGAARLSALTLTPRVFSPHGSYAAPSVAIGFTLGRPGAVAVRVYNRAGRLVREVANGVALGAGANVVRWDGRDGNGREVEDGAYLVAIGAFGETQTRALAVVR